MVLDLLFNILSMHRNSRKLSDAYLQSSRKAVLEWTKMSIYEEIHFYVHYYLSGLVFFLNFPLVKGSTNKAWCDLCGKIPVHMGFGKEYNCTWEAKSRMVRLLFKSSDAMLASTTCFYLYKEKKDFSHCSTGENRVESQCHRIHVLAC